MMADLFGWVKTRKPRTTNYKLMGVCDAGDTGCADDPVYGGSVIRFACRHCRKQTDWVTDKWTITQNRQGHPCPSYNNLPSDHEWHGHEMVNVNG